MLKEFSKSLLLIFTSISYPVLAQTSLNLDFEYSSVGSKLPRSWNAGGLGYSIVLDTTTFFSGANSLSISYRFGDQFGFASRNVTLETVGTRVITLNGWIKTDSVSEGYAGFWIRTEGDRGVVSFNNMEGKGPIGTTDWTNYEVSVELDASVKSILIGMLLTGKGRAWFDNLVVKLDTNIYKDIPYRNPEPTPEEVAIIRMNAVPISNIEPGSDLTDLIKASPLFESAEIVALGEGTHGTSEFFKIKHKLIEHLTSNMGHSIIALEANMIETSHINDFVLSGIGDPTPLLKQLEVWPWYTQEMLNLLIWLKDVNLTRTQKIQFWGFDTQLSELSIHTVRNFISSHDKSYLAELNDKYREPEKWIQTKFKEFNIQRLDSVILDCKAILDYLEQRNVEYHNKNISQKVNWVIQNAKLIYQSVMVMKYGQKLRDRFMAENVQWIREHIMQPAKMVIWAHNSHISKKPFSMGYYLNELIGAKYLSVGLASHKGEFNALNPRTMKIEQASLTPSYPGTVEWFLHMTGIPIFLVYTGMDRKSETIWKWVDEPLGFRTVGSIVSANQFIETRISTEFDILCFIENSTKSQPLGSETK